jgi:hypothetical protein
LCVLLGIGVWSATLLAAALRPGAPALPSGPYADDPAHLWNRLHRELFVRTAAGGEYGFDEVDPLLWRETQHLLTAPSHARALRLLDEFLASKGERLVADPVKRVVFQHDLWAVFDWLADRSDEHLDARQALMPRVARVMRRVALVRDQIQQLPDTYAAAVASGTFPDSFDAAHPGRTFLPRDLLAADGSWSTIGGSDPVAAAHAGEQGRSAFSILWRVPGGSRPTRAYLDSLWDFGEPYVFDRRASFDGERRTMLNPALPPVPAGTEVALLRTMLAVDRDGAIVPTAMVERVQLRVFDREQRFFEVQMRRSRLVAGHAGGLEAVRPSDVGFLTFSSKGIDAFESPQGGRRGAETLAMCQTCHLAAGGGLPSILSVRRLLKPLTSVESRHPRWARSFTQAHAAAEHKARQRNWGLLQGLWYSHSW